MNKNEIFYMQLKVKTDDNKHRREKDDSINQKDDGNGSGDRKFG